MAKKRVFGCTLSILITLIIVLVLLTIFGVLGGPIGQNLAEKFTFLQPIVDIFPQSLLVKHTPEPSLAPGVLIRIGNFPITNTMITAWITIILLILVSYLAFRKPKMVPTGLQKVIEYIYNAILDFCISVAGEKNARRFFPFVGTIFLFIITNAYLGLLPFFGDALMVTGADGEHIPLLRAANTDLNVPLALALFAWISIETFGIRANRLVPYIKKFINTRRLGMGFSNLFHGKVKSALGDFTFGVIDLFVGLLELLSEFIRLISFTFRLFGNMTAGEVLILVVGFLAPLVLGSVIYGLELFFGLLQALIFGGLTLVWMNMAIEKHSEEEHS
jgi:F-type H+-transporting ATPase subunit a